MKKTVNLQHEEVVLCWCKSPSILYLEQQVRFLIQAISFEFLPHFLEDICGNSFERNVFTMNNFSKTRRLVIMKIATISKRWRNHSCEQFLPSRLHPINTRWNQLKLLLVHSQRCRHFLRQTRRGKVRERKYLPKIISTHVLVERDSRSSEEKSVSHDTKVWNNLPK